MEYVIFFKKNNFFHYKNKGRKKRENDEYIYWFRRLDGMTCKDLQRDDSSANKGAMMRSRTCPSCRKERKAILTKTIRSRIGFLGLIPICTCGPTKTSPSACTLSWSGYSFNSSTQIEIEDSYFVIKEKTKQNNQNMPRQPNVGFSQILINIGLFLKIWKNCDKCISFSFFFWWLLMEW